MKVQDREQAPGFDPKSLNALGKLISELERFNLEGAIPEEFSPDDLFEESEQTFFHVQGLADFWMKESGADFKYYTIDMVISAHGQRQADLTMVMLGTPRQLSVYISLGTEETTRTLLEGIFPGVRMEKVTRDELVALIRPHCLVQGVLTGVPSRKDYSPERFNDPKKSGGAQTAQASQQNQSLLERVIRGMYGATWCYIVQAHPRPRAQVVQD